MGESDRIAGLEKAYSQLITDNKILAEKISMLQSTIVHSELREAAKLEGVSESAVNDVLLHDRHFTVGDDSIVRHSDGLAPRDWVRSMRSNRPHWWERSEGGGSKGSKQSSAFPKNPWLAEHWNLTAQGQIEREDPKKAEAMAKAAGVALYAAHPAKKRA